MRAISTDHDVQLRPARSASTCPWGRVGAVRRWLALALLAALAGCGGMEQAKVVDGGSDSAGGNIDAGISQYAQLCASCHGDQGQGGIGPTLRNWSKGRATLVDTISKSMPEDKPGSCTGSCAGSIADYILANFTGVVNGNCTAGTVTPTARGLRLLTRREYIATVDDLLGIAIAASATTTPTPTPTCNPTTFTFDPKGQSYKTVHVAGSFNGWPGTIAAGGYAMAYSATTKRWSVAEPLAAGSYTYKLVLDESQWITDPSDAQTMTDASGNVNSALTVICTSTGMPLPPSVPDPTTGFPPDVRPQGFLYDDDGPDRTVSDLHVEQYQDAAAALAASVTTAANLATLVGCDFKADASGCASTFVTTFGQRAFRRPLSKAEVARYHDLIVGQTDFASGVRLALRALLASPNFLYRSEIGDAQSDGTARLSPYEVASALSYQLWGTMPDAGLLTAAAAGDLGTPAGIEKQARRLLADPRARDMVALFAEQWLGSEHVSTVEKRADLFPGFSADVRAAMRQETRRFVSYVVFDGTHGYDELVNANYSFLDGALGQLYGVSGVTGSDFVKTPYADGQRVGILGQGSVLATTAHSDQTSPILRGLYVRRNLLCQEFPTPPPNAGGLPAVDPTATTRQRFAMHSATASCSSCHKYIDSVGFGFERFDPIGLLRATENGQPIDSSGDMNDVEGLGTGTAAPFATLPSLATTLSASAAAKSCLVRQYFRFARGFHEAASDSCTINALVNRFASSGWDIRELMIGIVLSPEFILRT